MITVHRDGQVTAREDAYRALLAVSEAIVSHRDLAALFRELAGRLQQVARFDYVGLHLHEAASGTMHLHVLEPSAPAVRVSGLRFPVEDSPAGVVWQTQHPLIISNAAEETRWPRFLDHVRPTGGQSCCSLPLTMARRRLGTMTFACKQPAAYDAADQRFHAPVVGSLRTPSITKKLVHTTAVASSVAPSPWGGAMR